MGITKKEGEEEEWEEGDEGLPLSDEDARLLFKDLLNDFRINPYSPWENLLEEGKVFAGHRIDGVVGKGGMGVVYRATQLALDLTVALKVMSPDLASDDEFRERFRRESRLAASLDDPHVVPVRHAGEEEGLLYVTMRLVNGPARKTPIRAPSWPDTLGRSA